MSKKGKDKRTLNQTSDRKDKDADTSDRTSTDYIKGYQDGVNAAKSMKLFYFAGLIISIGLAVLIFKYVVVTEVNKWWDKRIFIPLPCDTEMEFDTGDVSYL